MSTGVGCRRSLTRSSNDEKIRSAAVPGRNATPSLVGTVEVFGWPCWSKATPGQTKACTGPNGIGKRPGPVPREDKLFSVLASLRSEKAGEKPSPPPALNGYCNVVGPIWARPGEGTPLAALVGTVDVFRWRRWTNGTSRQTKACTRPDALGKAPYIPARDGRSLRRKAVYPAIKSEKTRHIQTRFQLCRRSVVIRLHPIGSGGCAARQSG